MASSVRGWPSHPSSDFTDCGGRLFNVGQVGSKRCAIYPGCRRQLVEGTQIVRKGTETVGLGGDRGEEKGRKLKKG